MSMGSAQSYPAQYPSFQAEVAGAIREAKRAAFEGMQNTLAQVSNVVADLRLKDAAIEAQQLALAAQDVQILALLNTTIAAGSGSTTETNFVVPPGSTIRAPGTVAIPAGFTSAIVDLSVYAGAVDSLGVVKYIYVSAVINGVSGHEGVGGNDPASVTWVWATSRKVSVLSGLTPGGVITFGVAMRTSDTATWGANTSNRAYCDASVTFLR